MAVNANVNAKRRVISRPPGLILYLKCCFRAENLPADFYRGSANKYRKSTGCTETSDLRVQHLPKEIAKSELKITVLCLVTKQACGHLIVCWVISFFHCSLHSLYGSCTKPKQKIKQNNESIHSSCTIF